MAKNFDVKFEIIAQDIDTKKIMRHPIEGTENIMIAISSPYVKVTIHPESLKLLEPQEGDLLCDDDPTDGACRTWHLIELPRAIQSKWNRVIERDGKPFIMPKKEEDNG